jgi:hypothetical protein
MLATLHALASDLINEISRLDERITAITAQITTAVAASGTTLTQLHGIGTLLAGKILALVGSIDRFRSAAAFASYTGTARSKPPPAMSSATGSPVPGIDNSTIACTSWPSRNSATTPAAGPTTGANAPPVKAIEKRCAV